MKNRFLRVFEGTPVDRPPFWFMRQAGRYLPEYRKLRQNAGSFLDLCYNSELAAEVTLQPIRRYEMDAAILFADILLICEAMGQNVTFTEGVGPQLSPTVTGTDLESLTLDNIESHLAPVFETVRRVRGELDKDKALIGFAGAPWTVATYMVEGGTSKTHALTKRFAFSDPDNFQRLTDLLVDGTARYLIRQIQAGADAVQLFDSWAGALPADALDRWSLKPMQAIAARVKDRYPDVPVIVFPRGVGVSAADYAPVAEFDAIGLDSTIPMAWAAEHIGPHAVIQGNLDQELLVTGGPVLNDAAARIFEATRDQRFIFNLGHGIVPETPPDHVFQLSELIRAQAAT